MKKTRIIFFGTHTFAAAILEALINEPALEIALVITQPDRPIGRSQQLQKSPIKLLSEKHKLKMEQPQSLKSFQFPVSSFQLGITAQYGALIPKQILAAPKHGILNIHPSLLPKYRGASPIQTAIMNGDAETGVTIMKMDEGLDTGPIILQKKLALDPDETYPEVEAKLAKLGAEALLEAIPKYLAGELSPDPQVDAQATHCQQLTRDDGRIDWRRSAREIYNQYRALTPWPGVWTTWQGKRLKLLYVRLKLPLGMANANPHQQTGQVTINQNHLFVHTSAGIIEILELQMEGKKPMLASMFIVGHKQIDDNQLV